MYCTVDKSHSSGAPATQTKSVRDGKFTFILKIHLFPNNNSSCLKHILFVNNWMSVCGQVPPIDFAFLGYYQQLRLITRSVTHNITYLFRTLLMNERIVAFAVQHKGQVAVFSAFAASKREERFFCGVCLITRLFSCQRMVINDKNIAVKSNLLNCGNMRPVSG